VVTDVDVAVVPAYGLTWITTLISGVLTIVLSTVFIGMHMRAPSAVPAGADAACQRSGSTPR
jgi:hypothetical protein